MSSINEFLKKHINENRPKLSTSSVNTYISILKNLWNKYKKDDDKDINLKFFQNQDNIIKHLKDVKFNIRKTILSALIILVGDEHNKKYRDLMMKDAEEYKSNNLKQEKTEQMEKNWITQDEVKNKFEELLKNSRGLWTKELKTKADFKILQDLIIVAITSGILGLPPRRSLDWVEFVIHPNDNIDMKKHNYLEKNKLHFNTYKGADKKGEQIIEAPKKLIDLLKKWKKYNTNTYLLVDSSGNKMSSVKLNQHLNKIWGKKSGVNIMRHSFISEKYPIFNVEKLKEDAEKMGSSANMMLDTYIKKN